MQAMPPSVKRVMAATDRSATADQAAHWAAHLAESYGADLLLLRVLDADGDSAGEALASARGDLQDFARELAGSRGRALVTADGDPVQAILDVIEDEHADVVVLGNAGMSGRKQFLLGNIPNRVSHKASCTVIIVNTATGATDGPAVIAPETPGERMSSRLLKRSWRIGRVLVGAGIKEWNRRGRGGDEAALRERAQRMRAAMLELGPTFAKLGQILSTRPDLLPQAVLDELATLQERVTPLSEAEVVAMMERELQVPWEDVFASIDPQPLAAGTIAQVHRAVLETGERVVVKVQRPNAERDILDDLGLLELFAKRAAARPAFRQIVDLPAIIEHLSGSLRKELDFRSEAANLKRMSEVIAPFSRLKVPQVYEDYSTQRLLVMQEVQGVPLQQAPQGEARKEAARQLLESYYAQVLDAGFFHADPHPGNMKWWNDCIYMLDLGMVGEVDAEVRGLIVMLLLAFTQEDASFLTEIVLMLAGGEGPPDAAARAAFEADLHEFMARYRSLSLRDIQLGPMLQEITEISVRHKVRVPSSLTLVGKAFAQMQLAAAELDPELDPFSVAESFMLRNTLGKLRSSVDPKSLFYEAQKAKLRLTRIVEAVESLVGARPGAKLQVQFRGTDRLEATIAQAGRRLSYAFGLSGAFVAMGVAMHSGRSPKWLPALMGAVGGTLSAGLVLDVARSLAGGARDGNSEPPSGASPGATIARQ
jgi:predicted unusual protein kinase regulating ubiquinone biosynthesis (AarF/ABC1/UbiB family)/nucleotide-binding universal stress UspA family protein